MMRIRQDVGSVLVLDEHGEENMHLFLDRFDLDKKCVTSMCLIVS